VGHTVVEEIATQALQHFLVLEALEDLLKQHGELGSGRHLVAFKGALAPAFVNNEVAQGGGALGVIPESWSPTISEGEDATTSPTLCLLKTRPVHVSSSSDSTTTTPFCLSSTGTEVAEVGGVMGVEVATPAAVALRLASRSANFFLLSFLKPIFA